MTGRAPCTRTMHAAHLNEVANHPAVRPLLGGEGPIDLAGVVANPLNVALESEHGGYIAEWKEPGLYEVHSLFLPTGRGAEAMAAMKAALLYMFTQTDAVDLLTKVPSNNKAAAALAQMAGFTERFNRKKVWPKAGGPFDLSFMGLDVWTWTKRADETRQAGTWFHEKLEAAKIAAGSDLPVHEDEAVHDQAVGACVLMCRAGNCMKGVGLYNRWAKFAGYAGISLVQDHPCIIDVMDAVVALSGAEMEVLLCR